MEEDFYNLGGPDEDSQVGPECGLGSDGSVAGAEGSAVAKTGAVSSAASFFTAEGDEDLSTRCPTLSEAKKVTRKALSLGYDLLDVASGEIFKGRRKEICNALWRFEGSDGYYLTFIRPRARYDDIESSIRHKTSRAMKAADRFRGRFWRIFIGYIVAAAVIAIAELVAEMGFGMEVGEPFSYVTAVLMWIDIALFVLNVVVRIFLLPIECVHRRVARSFYGKDARFKKRCRRGS